MMNVGQLIAELQKLDAGLPVRVSVGSAKDTVFATTGEVSVAKGEDRVTLSGWASNTRMTVESNDADGEDEEDPNDPFSGYDGEDEGSDDD